MLDDKKQINYVNDFARVCARSHRWNGGEKASQKYQNAHTSFEFLLNADFALSTERSQTTKIRVKHMSSVSKVITRHRESDWSVNLSDVSPKWRLIEQKQMQSKWVQLASIPNT